MLSDTVVELARWQFAITAMLHFLFIPLSLGLGLLLALLETAHAVTGRPLFLAQIAFWQRIFAIDFVLTLVTRLTVLFQFGSNGSYFSHYVGDVFALPLAIEAITSFFVAATLFAPYWFGRQRLGKFPRLVIVWLLALAVHGSAYWIMVSNAWMQNPVAAAFDPVSYRLELLDLAALLNNSIIVGKYLHILAASHAAAAAAVLAIAAWRLLGNGEDEVARSSFRFAAVWGVGALLLVAAATDTTPQLDTPVQRAKLAAIAGENDAALLGDIETRIRSGIEGYRALLQLRDESQDPKVRASFLQHRDNLGYAMLLQPVTKQIVDAKPPQISRAAHFALPAHPGLLYWSYRLMMACGIVACLGFAVIAWRSGNAVLPTWLPGLGLYLAPLPWLACVAGWFISEAGKQPWAIAGMLPTFAAVSTLTTQQLIVSSLGYAAVYALMLAIAVRLLKLAVAPAMAAEGEPA